MSLSHDALTDWAVCLVIFTPRNPARGSLCPGLKAFALYRGEKHGCRCVAINWGNLSSLLHDLSFFSQSLELLYMELNSTTSSRRSLVSKMTICRFHCRPEVMWDTGVKGGVRKKPQDFIGRCATGNTHRPWYQSHPSVPKSYGNYEIANSHTKRQYASKRKPYFICLCSRRLQLWSTLPKLCMGRTFSCMGMNGQGKQECTVRAFFFSEVFQFG